MRIKSYACPFYLRFFPLSEKMVIGKILFKALLDIVSRRRKGAANNDFFEKAVSVTCDMILSRDNWMKAYQKNGIWIYGKRENGKPELKK